MDSSCASGCKRAAIDADEVNELVAEQVARDVPYKFGRAALRTRLVNFVLPTHGPPRGRPARHHAGDPGRPGGPRRARRGVAVGVALRARPRPACRIPSSSRRAPTGSSTATSRTRSGRRAAARRGRPPISRWSTKRATSSRGTRQHLRPRDRRRGAGPLADAAADDRTARAQRVGHRARRPRAGDRRVDPRLVGRRGGAPADRECLAGRPDPESWRSRDLTLGYRVPGLVLDFAAQLLPEAAPDGGADGIGAGRAAPAAAAPGRRRRPLPDGRRGSRRARGRGLPRRLHRGAASTSTRRAARSAAGCRVRHRPSATAS